MLEWEENRDYSRQCVRIYNRDVGFVRVYPRLEFVIHETKCMEYGLMDICDGLENTPASIPEKNGY